MTDAWQILTRELLIDAPWLRVESQHLRLPNGNEVRPFHHCWEPDWVCAIPHLPDGRLVLVEQYRHGIAEITWEFPGGNIDAGEDPAEAALRELREECGCRPLAEARPLACLAPNPCRNACRGHAYAVPVASELDEQRTDDGEDIAIRIVEQRSLELAIAEGRFCHAAHVAWYLMWIHSQAGQRA